MAIGPAVRRDDGRGHGAAGGVRDLVQRQSLGDVCGRGRSLRMQQIAHVAGSATRPGCAAEEASQVLCRP